jgi:hypothetical protein
MAENEGGTVPSWRVRHLATHGTGVLAVAVARLEAGPAVATGGDDGYVRTWSLAEGGPLFTASEPPMDGRRARPTAVTWVAGRLVAGWDDGQVTGFPRWDGQPPGRVAAHAEGSWVTSLVTFSPGEADHRLVSAATDGSVVLWQDMGTPAVSLTLRSGGAAAHSLAAVPTDAGHVVHASIAERRIERWLVTPDGRVDPLEPLAAEWWVPESIIRLGVGRRDDGRPILVATGQRQILALDEASTRPGAWLSGDITAFHIPGDGRLAVAGTEEGRLELVNLPGTDRRVETLQLGDQRISAIGSLGDTFVVGDAGGGVWVVEPVDEAAAREPVVSDKVELLDDVPGETRGDDRLRRSPLAGALAVRLERRHEEGRERSFLVHLDGAWGSGKTTVLNFVADSLGPDWTIVRYNAWRQSRIGPHWWTLLTALRDEILRRRSPLGRLALWTREMGQQRIRRASGLPATVLLLLVALAVYLRIRPDGTTASEVFTTAEGVGAVGVGLATLFAGAQLVARFFGWHSPRGAKAFQDLDTNPMDRVAEHFSWLVRQEERPIAYFVDDLDRCPAGDVVELLESIQTLVRDAGDERGGSGGGGRDAVLSPCFVVAGDGAWIRNAFETHYAEFAGPIAEPGRPLGYLFLAKIFQLTLPVPRIAPVRQAAYFRELLGLDEAPGDPDDPAASPEAVQAAGDRVARAPHDAAQQEVLAALPLSVREAVAPVAVQRQNEPAFAEATEHRLTGFAELLPDNPRAVKRFLNTFALTRSVRTIEGQAIPTGSLALWTILQTRWPRLADALADHPEWVTPGSPGVPDEVRELLDADDVQAVLAFPDGGPLTPELVRACRGG